MGGSKCCLKLGSPGNKHGGFGFDPARPTPQIASEIKRGRKVDGFGFDPARPTADPTLAVVNDVDLKHGRKADGFGFDPAHPTLDPLVAENDGFTRGRKVDGFGFDPKKPSPDRVERTRCKKVGDFGFDPAHPTPPPQPHDKGMRHTVEEWVAPSFEEAKLHASHRGIRIHAPPGGKSTLTLN